MDIQFLRIIFCFCLELKIVEFRRLESSDMEKMLNITLCCYILRTLNMKFVLQYKIFIYVPTTCVYKI